MEEKVSRVAALLRVQHQLQLAAQNARASDLPAPVLAVPAAPEAPDDEKEEEVIEAAGVRVTVSSELSALSGAEFRQLLRQGWAALPAPERTALAALLPAGAVAPEALLSGAGTPGFFGDPVDQFVRRFRLGLLS